MLAWLNLDSNHERPTICHFGLRHLPVRFVPAKLEGRLGILRGQQQGSQDAFWENFGFTLLGVGQAPLCSLRFCWRLLSVLQVARLEASAIALWTVAT